MTRNKYKVKKNNNEKQSKTNVSNFINSNEFEGLIGFEEISSCTLIKKSKYGNLKRTVVKDGKIVKKVRLKMQSCSSYIE